MTDRYIEVGKTGPTARHPDQPVFCKLTAAQQMALNWQPIETAPKDRNIIITGRYANGRAYVEEGHWDYKGHWYTRKHEPPTHWMPLPEPFGGWDAADGECAADSKEKS